MDKHKRQSYMRMKARLNQYEEQIQAIEVVDEESEKAKFKLLLKERILLFETVMAMIDVSTPDGARQFAKEIHNVFESDKTD